MQRRPARGKKSKARSAAKRPSLGDQHREAVMAFDPDILMVRGSQEQRPREVLFPDEPARKPRRRWPGQSRRG